MENEIKWEVVEELSDENGTPKGTAPFPSMVVIYNRKDNQ